MGVSLFVAVVYIVVNFLVDVLYGVIDPRIRIS
jgi:peptide/nickel transport system permease protein